MSQSYRTSYIFFISFISALGGYLFGFDFAVISGALPFLKENFALNAYQEGFTTASLALGCMIGCLLASRASERMGRRWSLFLAALIFAFSSLFMAAAASISQFILARFFAGCAVGMASVLSPMYIAEISPAPLRGRMVSLNQLAIVIGILVTNCVNYFLSYHGADAWRWMFASGAIPATCFLAGILLLPESPSWLMERGKKEKALNILRRIGNESYAQAALSVMTEKSPDEKNIPYKALFSTRYKAALLAGIGLAVFQQFCGINVVFNYTASIFESIGFDQNDQLLQTVFIGAVNLIFTLLALTLVDRVGRKPLMLGGAASLSVLHLVIAIALATQWAYTSVALLAAIAIYACTLAPVTWVLISEIFPGKIRSKATSFSVLCLWAAYFVLTFSFPVLADRLGGVANTFYIYALVCAVGTIFILTRIKETKGIALEKMDRIFGH